MDIIEQIVIHATQSATLNPVGGQVDAGTTSQHGYKEISVPSAARAETLYLR
jgi:hypothetical protein